MLGAGVNVSLTAKEREIAISAIGARVSGGPAEAAKQLLAGVAVLDGQHAPFLILPEEISRQEMAAWHEDQAAYWRDSAARHDAVTARSAAQTPTSSRNGDSTALVGTTPPHSV